MMSPEELARQKIDALLTAAGWSVQDYKQYAPGMARGTALRDVPLASGECDYLLLVDRQPVGVIEAKRVGKTLSTVADQSAHYAANLPAHLAARLPPSIAQLPFLYESTGVETFFRDERDPHPRSRRVFAFHQPQTLAAWFKEPQTLRARLAALPTAHPLPTAGMRACQIEAITKLEASFAADRPRALIQMATGAGKTFTACAATYRLIKHAGARRVLFLVDRANLGRQAVGEFHGFVTPDTGRKFTELYNVQHLTSNQLDHVSRVTVCTIQRLYSLLRGEELAEDLDEHSAADLVGRSGILPLTRSDKRQDAASTFEVAYNPAIPIEAFDFIVTDECHRSIYNLWRQVLEYFDSFLVGLTATPAKQTIAFFNQNLVTEYGHERAVADGVNVGYDVYRIQTEVTAQGGTVEKGFVIDKRSRATRAQRQELLDEDLGYTATELDRSVVVPSQIRTVLQAYRDALPTALFPGRTLVPKTLVFAKDDSHAEDIVHICREVFGKGNDFCKKITYQAKHAVTGRPANTEQLIQEFRTSPQLRIAVTVDMIATGTDIKPLEVLLFLRDVRSRVYFEQMKGRGTRVLTPTDLQAVSGESAQAKTHFVIVDAVGVCESDKTESRPLERQPGVAFDKLLLGVAFGARDEDTLTSVASRLARLDRAITPARRAELAALAGGRTLAELSAALLRACDPDEVEAASRRLSSSSEETAATELATTYFDPFAPVEITEANLPHWRQDGATYFVTFRLADSIPHEKLAQWQEERELWFKHHPLPLSAQDQSEYHRRFSSHLEHWLDQGSGSCVLGIPECRAIVETALRHFDGNRYTLGEFVIAPNHVHVLLTPRAGHDLSQILHSWKSFTSKKIAKVEAASRRLSLFWDSLHERRLAAARHQPSHAAGPYVAPVYQRPVWQKESYDHIVRSAAALHKIEEYIRGHSTWEGEDAEGKRRDAASTLLAAARQQLADAACAPFDAPAFRDALAGARQEAEQTIDTVTVDKVITAGFDAGAKEKAQSLVQSFRDYLNTHRAEIDALQILYSRPYAQRLTEGMLKALEKKLRDNHAAWTEDNLWNAFATAGPERVRGRSQAGRFADLVALVRFALEQQPVLRPFAESVGERYNEWRMDKAKAGTAFTPDQAAWLDLIRDHIATSLSIEAEDFDYAPFSQRGGLGKAHQLFGDELPTLLDELNAVLVA